MKILACDSILYCGVVIIIAVAGALPHLSFAQPKPVPISAAGAKEFNVEQLYAMLAVAASVRDVRAEERQCGDRWVVVALSAPPAAPPCVGLRATSQVAAPGHIRTFMAAPILIMVTAPPRQVLP